MRHFACLLILLATAVSSLAAPPPRIPVETLLRPLDFSEPRLSPDGRHVAVIVHEGWERQFVVMNLATRAVQRFKYESDRQVGWFEWKDSDRLIFGLTEDGQDLGGIFTQKRDGTELRNLVSTLEAQVRQEGRMRVRLPRLLSRLEREPDHILVSVTTLGSDETKNEEPEVYRINVKTGRGTKIQSRTTGVYEWMVDYQDQIRLGARLDKDRVTWIHRPNPKAAWEPMFEEPLDGPTFRPLRFDPDGKTLYVASNRGRSTDAVWAFDTTTRQFGKELFAPKSVDADDVMVSRKTGAPVAVLYHDEIPRAQYLDPDWASTHTALSQALPGPVLQIMTRSADDRLAVVRSFSDRDPGALYIVDLNSLKAGQWVKLASWLKPEQMAEMRPIQYKARDGRVIRGYLSLPAGVPAKNLPLVVNPHGGPQARDYWGFNPEVQFLCNRGYAVLQVNFRGSTGYGHEFEAAGFGEWGRAMQDDLTDGVAWCVAEGYADPKRVAIYGASYGGYATMAGLCFTPDLYRCGVNYVGVTDLGLLIEKYRTGEALIRRMVERLVGPKSSREATIRERSPVYHASKIKVPVLMYYGIDDPRVPIEHGDRMAAALKSAGKKYQYMTKAREGHGFVGKKSQVEFYNALESFLETHLGQDRSGAAPAP
jgi:dipeptidyl aminopeptidase/acylaminoacyl peptidase